MRLFVSGWELNALAIAFLFFFCIALSRSKNCTIAVGSYPALYMYWTPRKSAWCSNSRENFSIVMGIAKLAACWMP